MNYRKAARGQDCMIEEWKEVPDWPVYEVSSIGNVRSKDRMEKYWGGERKRKGRMLKPKINTVGYYSVQLCNYEKTWDACVHRLVALTFLPQTGPIVRHLDGDSLNNSLHNLAWGSYKDNEADKLRHGRRPLGVSHPNSVLSENTVRKIRELHKRGHSQLKIAAQLGIGRGPVGHVVRGQSYKNVY